MTHEASGKLLELAAKGRYLSDRFEWASPGDQQEDAWIVRFSDNDVRDMLFTGGDAERDAWAAWERHAPGYNMYVFRLARLSTPSSDLKADNAVLVALQMVEDAMRRQDGEIIGYGWNITALNKARPFIHAALQAGEKL